MLQNWLKDLSIDSKLRFLSFASAAVSGITGACLIVLTIWHIESGRLQEKARAQAEIVAENVKSAVLFSDPKAANEALSALGRDNEVMALVLTNIDGERIAEFHSPFYGEPGSKTERNVEASAIVTNEQLPVANVMLRLSTRNVQHQVALLAAVVFAASLLSLWFALAVVRRLRNLITAPLRDLTSLMRQVSDDGDLSSRANLGSRDELGLLGKSFNQMIQQIQDRDVALGKELAERNIAEQKLEHLAHHDQVTGLPNRHFFRRHARQFLTEVDQEPRSVSLLFIDLDNFKYVNDTFGHNAGDKLLNIVAQRLRTNVRAKDTVVRFGGDEFVVLLEGVCEQATLEMLSKKLLSEMRRPVTLEDNEFVVTCSVGAAMLPAQAKDFDELLQRADAAMYSAKGSGKNACVIWHEDLSTEANWRFGIEADLRLAMRRSELTLHYQPIVDLKSFDIVGFEALMRWEHPTRGFVSPTEFIPIAEDCGLIGELGEFAMRTAAAQIAQWNRQRETLFVAVNVSCSQFLAPGFSALVDSIIRKAHVSPAKIEFEVTESVVMGNIDKAVRVLSDLSSAGIRLSLDDFGTGYSSLAYLKRFPINKLKIDRSFISNLPGDIEDAVISETIVNLSRSLNMRVVAEGVELLEQVEMLKSMGCHFAQGYFFCKPLAAAEIESQFFSSQEIEKSWKTMYSATPH